MITIIAKGAESNKTVTQRIKLNPKFLIDEKGRRLPSSQVEKHAKELAKDIYEDRLLSVFVNL